MAAQLDPSATDFVAGESTNVGTTFTEAAELVVSYAEAVASGDLVGDLGEQLADLSSATDDLAELLRMKSEQMRHADSSEFYMVEQYDMWIGGRLTALSQVLGVTLQPVEPNPTIGPLKEGPYGTTKAETFEYKFTPVEGYGQLKVALFISDPEAGMWIDTDVLPDPGPNPFTYLMPHDIELYEAKRLLNSHGDDRDFDADAEITDSRALFTIDFERGVVSGRINPSCGLGGRPDDCHSALELANNGHIVSDLAEFLPGVADTNRVEIREDGSTINLQIAIKNADKKTIAPRVNANLAITPVNDDDYSSTNKVITIDYDRDPFPDMEIYRRGSEDEDWQTVHLDPSEGQAGISLLPMAPNHTGSITSTDPP